MPLAQYTIQAPVPRVDSSTPVDGLAGKFGEALCADLHPKYFNQAIRDNLWVASADVGAPVAIPLMATNASPTFGIFNPAGNNKAFVICRYNVQFTAGTGVAGGIGYAYLSPAGSATAGTAAPISTSTAGIAMKSAILGKTYNGNLRFVIAATIGGAVSALTLHSWSNLSQGAPITSTASYWNLFEDIDGRMIVPPNTLWCTVASVAIAETVSQSVLGYEIPWPLP